MSINLNNYEAYFLDYYEGKLGPEQMDELMSFLEEHPHLKDMFGEYEEVLLTDIENEEITFDEKHDLKKKLLITKENYEQYFIGSVENQLNDHEKQQLELFLAANPSLRSELELFAKTKLAPDLSIVYPGKDELKRGKRRPVVLWYYGAAAAIALLLGLFFLFKGDSSSPVTVANNNKPEKDQPAIVKDSTATPAANNESLASVPAAAQGTKRDAKKRSKTNDHSRDDQKQLKMEDDLAPPQSPIAVKENTTNPLDSASAPMIAQHRNEVNIRLDDPVDSSAAPAEDYTSLGQVVAGKLKAGLLKEQSRMSDAKGGLSRWDFVALGLKAYRKITGRETEMQKVYNEEGQVIAYEISAGGLSFGKKLAKQ